MNRKQAMLMMAAAGCALAVSAQDQVAPLAITEVTLAQDRATQDVTVSYRLANDGVPAVVRLDILTNSASIGIDKLKSVWGDVSRTPTNYVADDGALKTIHWAARADWKGNLSSNAQACVTAYYTNQVAGEYMVIDLSKGTAATSSNPYPISYTFYPPDLTGDSTCFSNKLWLKRIEKGSFYMGSPENEIGRLDPVAKPARNESRHLVTFTNSFFASVFPMTYAQYRLINGSLPAWQTWDYNATYPQTTPSAYPIFYVSYNELRGSTLGAQWPASSEVDSNSFIYKMRTRTNLDTLDLPTEAQWEYACRAGSTTAWYNGVTTTNAALALGWSAENSGIRAKEVGTRVPNAWGIYDMCGSVWEWCCDWSGAYPADAVEPRGAQAGTGNRIYRGGSWANPVLDSRAARRGDWTPDTHDMSIGFRIFYTIKQ